MKKRGHGEGTIEWDERRGCYYVKVSYRDPTTGITKRKKLKGSTRKGESLKIGQKWLSEIENGLLPDADKITVAEWIDRWLVDYAKPRIRVKSYDKYEGCLRCYVKPYFGDLALKRLNAPDVQRLLNKLLVEGGRGKTGISSSTVRATRRYFSMCVEKAVKIGLIAKNVIKDTEAPKLVKKEIKPLNKEQAQNLINEARRYGEMEHMAILLALSTGMRLGEVFGLAWDFVDLEKGVIYVSRALITNRRGYHGELFQEPKTRQSRRQIPLPPKVVKELVKYNKWQAWQKRLLGDKYQDLNLVLTNQFGRPVDTSNFITRVFKKLLNGCGIDESTKFHDLRHTHATLLLLEGINPKIVSERLGHTTIALTLDQYVHILPHMQKPAVDALEEMLQSTNDNWRESNV